MASIDELFESLSDEVGKLKEKFLKPFLPARPEHSPETFEYEVKSFSVLCHAALEEFIEAISDTMMRKVEQDLLQQKASIATVCFALSYAARLDISEDDDGGNEKTCFEHVRAAIAKAKADHSKVLMDNHGVSAKYMRKLLVPVGINMPRGPEML